MTSFEIRTLTAADQSWIGQFLEEHWGSTVVISRGQTHDADKLPGFAAVRQGQPVGLATYCITGDACELVTLNSEVEGMGIGAALVTAVKNKAVESGCRRLWLITTNDNLPALGFYQRRGLRITAVHSNALEISRRLKLQIPQIGLDGIPLRDEIELETMLD